MPLKGKWIVEMKNEKIIWVYANWESIENPQLMGCLLAQKIRGREVFSFEYNENWLKENFSSFYLDPNLGFYKGKQFLLEDKTNFGIFTDSSPDRWGRLLMRRREALQAKEESRQESLLFESDYLLGVFDKHRMGAIRFKLDVSGDFLNNQQNLATPPWTSLRELEHASIKIESEDAIDDPEYKNWLQLLMVPGSSLGGARPKASVVDQTGNLWIAKFPSSNDHKNTGAWEMLLHELAKSCGIQVPNAQIQKFSGKHHTYLSQRFDRNGLNRRIHFASAMTLLGKNDGADFQDGTSYLDIASFILQYGADVKNDLKELWTRVVFNILVSNTDDHLRNHGFLLNENGWKLSPAYDMNPNEMGNGLTLNISDQSNEQDIELALATSKFYQLTMPEAKKILENMVSKISLWKSIALKLGISKTEIELAGRAFRLVKN